MEYYPGLISTPSVDVDRSKFYLPGKVKENLQKLVHALQCYPVQLGRIVVGEDHHAPEREQLKRSQLIDTPLDHVVRGNRLEWQ